MKQREQGYQSIWEEKHKKKYLVSIIPLAVKMG